MPELPAIAPISRNIGIADNSQLAANTNGVSESELRAVRHLRLYQTPRNAIVPIATPIGTRNPISRRIPAMLTSESDSVLMRALCRGGRARDRRSRAAAGAQS